MHTKTKEQIEKQLSKGLTGENCLIWESVGGGSINETYKVSAASIDYFVKINSKNVFKNGFKEEAKGLQFLGEKGVLTPKIIGEGSYKEEIFLLLVWIPVGVQTESFWQHLALQLASLHQQQSSYFGLDHDNFMGSIPQVNSPEKDFIRFFVKNRLEPQVQMAFDAGLLPPKLLPNFDRLYLELGSLLPKEEPSAVHGDLWSGNVMCSSEEKGVFIDPAVYWGHREVDLAMTTLFGGFSQTFYSSYQEAYPLEKGFQQRVGYYNLYPLLIHLNLFGRFYLRSVEHIVSPF